MFTRRLVSRVRAEFARTAGGQSLPPLRAQRGRRREDTSTTPESSAAAAGSY